jgi:NADH:ubiquinone oxidoreductase subunit 4 (subunit M)
MYQRVMLGQPNAKTLNFADLTWSELSVFVILISAIFICGVYPKPIFTIAQPALDNIFALAWR